MTRLGPELLRHRLLRPAVEWTKGTALSGELVGTAGAAAADRTWLDGGQVSRCAAR
jgi:hypothetical protein